MLKNQIYKNLFFSERDYTRVFDSNWVGSPKIDEYRTLILDFNYFIFIRLTCYYLMQATQKQDFNQTINSTFTSSVYAVIVVLFIYS